MAIYKAICEHTFERQDTSENVITYRVEQEPFYHEKCANCDFTYEEVVVHEADSFGVPIKYTIYKCCDVEKIED